ncbi:MAG: hypothetical protein HOI95_30405 [Chromatiales bacterium]|nr:hypothetical protein [Chromatiales bacterium]
MLLNAHKRRVAGSVASLLVFLYVEEYSVSIFSPAKLASECADCIVYGVYKSL